MIVRRVLSARISETGKIKKNTGSEATSMIIFLIFFLIKRTTPEKLRKYKHDLVACVK